MLCDSNYMTSWKKVKSRDSKPVGCQELVKEMDEQAKSGESLRQWNYSA